MALCCPSSCPFLACSWHPVKPHPDYGTRFGYQIRLDLVLKVSAQDRRNCLL
jgi:hypothetical protein